MANKKSFTGWCFQYSDGVLCEKVYNYRRDLIKDWETENRTWKKIRKFGNRAVKVEVKIIER